MIVNKKMWKKALSLVAMVTRCRHCGPVCWHVSFLIWSLVIFHWGLGPWSFFTPVTQQRKQQCVFPELGGWLPRTMATHPPGLSDSLASIPGWQRQLSHPAQPSSYLILLHSSTALFKAALGQWGIWGGKACRAKLSQGCKGGRGVIQGNTCDRWMLGRASAIAHKGPYHMIIWYKGQANLPKSTTAISHQIAHAISAPSQYNFVITGDIKGN